MNKQKYTKNYTRDTSLIIQQMWFDCAKYPLLPRFNLVEPFDYPVIFNINDGVIEIWEHDHAVHWLLDELQAIIARDPDAYIKVLDTYNEHLDYFKKYWATGVITNVAELQEFLDAVLPAMHEFDCMYYAGYDERTPPHIREKALAMRDVDVFFDNNDKLIRSSLLALYPDLVGLEAVILKNEIAHPPSIEILKQRKANCVVTGDELFLGTLQEFAQANTDLEFSIEKPTSLTQLNGQVGSKGMATGIVRILKRKEQIAEAKEGDIIVSTMTTPDFIAAMKLAAAIVTDEGGITCHAAIVARELGKPCVIGTKFATQVFKDGDKVMVDAEKGIVTKI